MGGFVTITLGEGVIVTAARDLDGGKVSVTGMTTRGGALSVNIISPLSPAGEDVAVVSQ